MSSQHHQWNERTWNYIHTFIEETRGQREVREYTAKMEESVMQISRVQASFMQFLVRLTGARKILEIGVFTGYSSLSMALAMSEEGRIVACDVSKEWTDVARKYWKLDGQSDKIDLRLGPATATLEQLIEDGHEASFDMAFIDADKQNYAQYYHLSLRLLKERGLLLIDNTLWSGRVADPGESDGDTAAIRQLNLKIQKDPRVHASLLPIADGLTLAYKLPLT